MKKNYLLTKKSEINQKPIPSSIKKFKKTSNNNSQDHDENENENGFVDTSGEILNHIKSLENFTQWLLCKLFDHQWEVRHGAATCLREIIKRLVHACENSLKSSLCNQNLDFFQDCLCKLLSVIALDRFADYVGDEAVAPVRETCSQTIGIVSTLFNYDSSNNAMLSLFCSIINSFLSERTDICWEIRHSGIMVLKYTIAATSQVNLFKKNKSTNETNKFNNLKLIFNLLFENILNCIRDKDDDVRQVASASLEPVSKYLKNILNKQQLESLIRVLIDVLSDIDDLGTSSSTIMTLLSDLLSADDYEKTNCLNGSNETVKSIKQIFLRFLNNQSIIPRLLPFMQHSSLLIRQTTLETINKIIIAIDENEPLSNDNGINDYHENGKLAEQKIMFKFESMEQQDNLVSLFRLLYQQAILLSSEHAHKCMSAILEKLWLTLCNRLSSHCLINVCFPYITTWLLLLMIPSGQPIDSIYLISQSNDFISSSSFSSPTNNHQHFRQQSSSGSNSMSMTDQKEYIGSNQIRFEEKSVRDLIQIKCRILASRLLAILFDRIAKINEIDANTKERPINVIIQFLAKQINFKSGLQRFCFALLMIEWADLIKQNESIYLTTLNIESSTSATTSFSSFDLIKSHLATKILTCLDDENTIYFDEIALLFTRLQKDSRSLLSTYHTLLTKNNVNLSNIVSKNVFTFEDINCLTDLIQQNYLNNLSDSNSKLTQNIDLKLAVLNLKELNQQTNQEQDSLQLRSCFSLASAAIKLNFLCDRMNPMIRPLIDCIRFETNKDLQIIASKHLAILLNTCSKRTPNPVPKIFKNLLNYMCNDFKKTPIIQQMSNMNALPDKEYYDINRFYGILSDLLTINSHSDENIHYESYTTSTIATSATATSGQATTPKNKKKGTNSGTDLPTPNTANNVNNTLVEQTIKMQVEKRGAEFTFKSICQIYQDEIEQIIPELVQQPQTLIQSCLTLMKLSTLDSNSSNSNSSGSNELIQINDLNLDQNISKYQELINNLCLIEYISSCGTLNKKILDKFLNEIPNIMKLIKSPLTGVRHLASRCLSSISKQELVRSMSLLLEYVFDCLDNSEFNLFARQGAIELVYCLFEQLGDLIIPFTVIFIVPILKRMCDLDWYIRSIASQCFASLVKLYPLGISTNENNDLIELNSLNEITSKNSNILKMRIEQQDFLDQLMDNRKLKPYSLPQDVLIDVKLRPYQQMGVNWLAFLKQFNLHGILCDDMGLGKTLQSICLLAGDHNEKNNKMKLKDENEQNKSDDETQFVPSIIICPTTLTNHWYHEIERFVDPNCLRPFIYSGSVNEREVLRRIFFNESITANQQNLNSKNVQLAQAKVQLAKLDKNKKQRFNVFIISYETIRNDIVYLINQQWNYCILDEGHLIKSSKTKLSKSIKQIRASHRLILTGTPIQNNVTELWCLFDFLLPGYLGTEKQFHAKYGKYIAPQSASLQRSLDRALHRSKSTNNNNNNQSETLSNGANGNNNNNDQGFHQMSLIALESLHKQVLPFLLRRTKEEVLSDLPPKIIQDYYCEMSQLQMDLYQDFAKSNASENIKQSLGLFEEDEEQDNENKKEVALSSDKNNEHIFQALQYLRKVVNHPILVLKPDHPRWSKVQAELKSTNSSITDIKYSGKLVALRELLMECGIGLNGDDESNGNEFESSVLNQHRVLIFCQLKSMIDIIETEVLKKMNNVSFLRLDGTIPAADRFGVVRRFNSDPSIDILLLTTQIGGLGLNLTGADTVIFVEHDWNPQKDLQAMDRAHRIGQTKVVNVYRLITKQTIEEKIMSLQKFKLGIANSVVNIENSSLSSMGTEQLMNMFNKEDESHKKEQSGSGGNAISGSGSAYQRILDNINELWDENQYENEYNLDSFIKSLN